LKQQKILVVISVNSIIFQGIRLVTMVDGDFAVYDIINTCKKPGTGP